MDFFNLLFGFFTGSADQTSTSFRSFRRFFSIERIVAAAVDYFDTGQVKSVFFKIPKGSGRVPKSGTIFKQRQKNSSNLVIPVFHEFLSPLYKYKT